MKNPLFIVQQKKTEKVSKSDYGFVNLQKDDF